MDKTALHPAAIRGEKAKVMTRFSGKLAGSAALAALVANAALAQGAAQPASSQPEMLPRSEQQGGPARMEMPTPRDAFEQAFPQAKPAPLVQAWTVGQAARLVAVIEGIGAEGLDPADYDLQPLTVALAAGPSDELNQIASQSFVWLVEDLRDGRTPMDAREQWFVVDPDRDTYRTGDI